MKKTICLAIMMSLCMTMPVFAAGWEQRQDGTYYYLDRDGALVTDELIEYKDEFYYLDAEGRMAADRWVKLFDGESEMERWYYFQSNGAAYRSKGSDKAVLREINGAKYIFDEYGCMVYGWVNRDGTMVDEDDPMGWRGAAYYCGTEDEGWVTTGWKRIQVDTAKNGHDEKLKKQWFYFQDNGRKKANARDVRLSAPNGKEYIFAFDESGTMVSQKSVNPPEPTDKSGWKQKVPSSGQSSEDHSNGTKRWFYTKSNGSRVTNKIEKIDGTYYCFDEAGIMRAGILAVKDGKYKYTIHNSQPGDDLVASIDDLRQAKADGCTIMYFDEETGARRTGRVNLELVEGPCTLRFTSSGKATDGAYDGHLYDAGVLMKAENGKEVIVVNDKEYTVNQNGKILN